MLYAKQDENSIAVIGMSCRFPGAVNPEAFWKNLREGVESISFFSDQELRDLGVDQSLINDPRYIKAGGVIEGIDLFDASFFGYSAREAESIDPQQRLFLECAWQAMEDAGYPAGSPGRVTGVFGGMRASTYVSNPLKNISRAGSVSGFQFLTGNDKDYLTTRVSYKLNLKGPSMAVQTACSTSLVSVHMACESLRNNECDMALAGGVALFIPQKQGYLYHEGMILSPDGHCRAFDAGARGTVPGNGAGIVVLKRLDEALEDHDHIEAVVRGTSVNNDGSVKVGFTAPSLEGQVAVISDALAMADAHPETISYVETHGTGTFLGDPIEVEALDRVFQKQTGKKGFCALGSVKTNLGHLDAAAGIASLIKTILAIKHKKLPPSLNYNEANPKIDFENSPFFVNTKLAQWPENGSPRRAGVSSFGIGGTNAHVIIEEAPMPRLDHDVPGRSIHLLPLSAQSENALLNLVRKYEVYLNNLPGAAAEDICFTAGAGRTHFPYRLAAVAGSVKDLGAQLAGFARGKAGSGIVSGRASLRPCPDLAFLFTGQGSQYPGMGRSLYETQPLFRKTMDRCAAILDGHLDRPLLPLVFGQNGSPAALDQTMYAQPALFALEYSMAQLWRAWGVTASAVMGHSVGEYVAACMAGVFDLEDGLMLISARGRLMQALPPEGEMHAVFAGELPVSEAIRAYADEVSLAAVNGPEHVVISGRTESVNHILSDFQSKGIRTVKLNVSHAFHSPLMRPMISGFRKIAERVRYSPPEIDLISNKTGCAAQSDEVCNAAYWCDHILNPVRFDAGINTLMKNKTRLFLEIGPSPVLSGMGRRCQGADQAVLFSSLCQGRDDWKQLLETLGQLYVNGVGVDWAGFDQGYDRFRVSVPTYPFERKRYWIDGI